LTGCGDQGVPAEKPAVIGNVTQVGEEGFLLQAEEDLIQSGDLYSVGLLDETSIYLKEGDEVGQAERTDIRPGQRISLWIEGGVRETSPPQVNARVVLIQGEG
ncbi:hypothetical protein CEN49_19315, partial [Fischerella thermalis CCMEE 5273]